MAYDYWTFNRTVPGPMLRVLEGDTVEIDLHNAPDAGVTHSIDLHAVTGPGGGAKVMQIAPGDDGAFRFRALNPGVYIYHCATPMVAQHIASGMYGMIVVEPRAGLPKVDHEYYLMEGDFYLQGQRGDTGLRAFDLNKMLDERPDYVVFNGGVGSLTGDNAFKASVGDTVRIFFGVGGLNLTSSFHVIGAIFDRAYPEGSLTSEPETNVQTTHVSAGGVLGQHHRDRAAQAGARTGRFKRYEVRRWNPQSGQLRPQSRHRASETVRPPVAVEEPIALTMIVAPQIPAVRCREYGDGDKDTSRSHV